MYWNRRRQVFAYDIFVLLGLLLVGLAFAQDHASIRWIVPPRFEVVAKSMWLGSLGGVIISLKGVYDNACTPPWSNCYNLWHFGRPFSGAATGLVTVLIFTAINQPGGSLNRPVVYLAAFVLGMQEARFFTFVAEIGRIIVQVPATLKAQVGLRVIAIEPMQGTAGALMVLAGQGFEPGATVKVGGVALVKQVVATDGSSVAGEVPKLAAPGRVDVTVLNPSGSSAVLPDRFNYTV